tara:strand:+ start:1297 stop:2211 length:915 start_codon:yes stop_codon:yes gene_type:complete
MPKISLVSNLGKKASFTFVDNIVGKTMFNLIKKREKNIRPSHGSFNMFADADAIEVKLKKIVKEVSALNVTMPEIPDTLDRDTLNRIHESFHIAEEVYMLDDTNHQKLSEDINVIRRLLKEVNFLVHELENALFKTKKAAFTVFYIGEHNISDRVVLNSELRKMFVSTSMPNRVTLHVGYATIGKNLLHAAYDNDVELVKNGNIRPQLSLSTETIWQWNPINLVKTTQAAKDKHDERMRSKWTNEVREFVVNNNLQDYVGWKDPIHYNSVQPCYAYSNDEMSLEEWYHMIEKDGLAQVELYEDN